jgi:hypothetical protein
MFSKSYGKKLYRKHPHLAWPTMTKTMTNDKMTIDKLASTVLRVDSSTVRN